VDALDGAPGVRSARYAPTDEARISRLLEELSVREQQPLLGPGRTARFVAALSVADPEGRILAEAEGRRSGVIIRSPRGQGGFGYDPIFFGTGTEPDLCGDERRAEAIALASWTSGQSVAAAPEGLPGAQLPCRP